MKKLSKGLMLLLVLLSVFLLTGCKKEVDKVQGVTDTEIVVGNTAAVSGAYASVGVPFNDAIKAVFEEVNKNGGIGGRTIRFVTYDDEFNPEKGVTYTEKLVEDDKIFALVGHFGTPTVGATVDYIQEYGIPMVYAATGINKLYFQESLGNPVMAVQPIYKTDGRIMAARAIKEKVYGTNGDQALAANAKIGVIYTNDDAGKSIKEGIEFQLKELGRNTNTIYEAVSDDFSTAVTKLKNENVQVVIIAANQAPFSSVIKEMANASLIVPVFSSYVNADVTAVPTEAKTAGMPIYINAWVDVYSTKGAAGAAAFVETITNSSLSAEKKTAYYTNSFAIAGYIAAHVFLEGLKRVEESGKDLTFKSYIEAMESKPIDIPMGGTVDFGNGHRWGIDSMSLLKYTKTTVGEVDVWSFAKVREIETLTQILAK